MNILTWNCRGLGQPRSVPVLRELLRARRPDIICLFETLVQGKRIEDIRVKLGLDGSFNVDSIGRSGGIAVLWRASANCTVIGYSRNHVDLRISDPHKGDWRLTAFYGIPDRSRRRDSWNLLRRLSAASNLPWCVIGDMNDLLSIDDKKGGSEHPQWLFNGFRQVVSECGLLDLPLIGYPYTWHKSLGTPQAIEERLDRALVSSQWMEMFSESQLFNLVAPISDHSPILLQTATQILVRRKARFRFENSWLREDSLKDIVESVWSSAVNGDFLYKLESCSKALSSWGFSLSKRFKAKVDACKVHIEELRHKSDYASVKKVQELKEQLCTLLVQEEDYWRQRAKLFWLTNGDLNTKYFHRAATQRRRSNRIVSLVDDGGVVQKEEAAMRGVVFEYFQRLFTARRGYVDAVLDCINTTISAADNDYLLSPFSKEEFKTAISQMHPEKSAGPDGFNPAFYHRFWDLIGDDVYQTCTTWLSDYRFPPRLNDTHIVLIPKVETPRMMKEFRPISLCNVIYKILAKVLANRLQSILPKLIPVQQSAFVKGRAISDNVLLAFEVLHHMKLKNRGKKGLVALKMDITKAYDMVSWSYLEAVMLKMGFAKQWTDWIMMCVSTVNYSVVMNDQLVGPIKPSRGLRQGDPLSPYLFIICAQGLTALLERAERRQDIHGIRVCKGAPAISHLLFADDSILFCNATRQECLKVKQILNDYETASGQSVNFAKSGIFFSRNVCLEDREELSSLLQITAPLNTGRYLGMPSLIGRSKSSVFSFLKDRLWARLQSWKAKSFSFAGREVLIKAVAQAIPTYIMSCFLLPVSIIDKLEKMMNSFWWGSKKTERGGFNWFRWEKLCRCKQDGGLGFRDLECFNLALLGKQGWKLFSDPDSLVSRIFKAKYFPNGDFLSSGLGNNPSFTWRGIWHSKALIEEGFRWRVGDGTKIKVWQDPWLRDTESCRIQTAVNPQWSNLKVSDLMVFGQRKWDIQFLEHVFDQEDVESILRIPLSSSSVLDKCIWRFHQSGCYTVKTAYYQALAIKFRISEGQADFPWKKVWELKIPPKVKSFIWRSCSECLPTRDALQGRGIDVPSLCIFCDAPIENSWHLFFTCSFAKSCWSYLGLSAAMEACLRNAEGFVDCMRQIIASQPVDFCIKVAMVLWSIWKSRNEKLWNQLNITASQTCYVAMESLWDWMQVRKMDGVGCYQRRRTQCQLWHAPQIGKFKCNIDASVYSSSHATGIGMVCRDEKGAFVCCCLIPYAGSLVVKEAEAIGVLQALKWIRSLGLSDVVFESDAQLVVNAIRFQRRDDSEFGLLIKDCVEILKTEPGFSVQYVCRQANGVAHALAREARFKASRTVLVDIPRCIVNVMNMCCFGCS